jgi:hypothetical protein
MLNVASLETRYSVVATNPTARPSDARVLLDLRRAV